MGTCLHETTTLLNGACPTVTDIRDVFNVPKFAKYWSYLLNNSPPSFVFKWFKGDRFEADNSVSPTFIARGKLIKQDVSQWIQLNAKLRRLDAYGKGEPQGPILCNIPPLRVVLKCFHSPFLFAPDSKGPSKLRDKQALLYEQAVYSCIISNFVDVPFFVYPLGVIHQEYKRGDVNRGTIDDEMKQYLKIDEGTVRITVSEDCGDVDYRKYMTSEAYNARDIWQTVIQMLTALQVMQRNQLTHGDLHFGNILVKEDVNFLFNLNTQKVVSDANKGAFLESDLIRMRVMVKIFDWDHGHSNRISQAMRLSNPKTNPDSIINRTYDMVSYIKQLYNMLPNVTFSDCEFPSLTSLANLQNKYPWVLQLEGLQQETIFDDLCVPWPEEVHTMVDELAQELYDHAKAQVIDKTPPMHAEMVRITRDLFYETDTLVDTITLQTPKAGRKEITIGRHASNNVELYAPPCNRTLISLHHCQIIFNHTRRSHSILDLDTMHGTYVNNSLIPSGLVLLVPGDIVSFGAPDRTTWLEGGDLRNKKNPLRYRFECSWDPGPAPDTPGTGVTPVLRLPHIPTLIFPGAAAPLWSVISASVKTAEPCSGCGVVIPAYFMRMHRVTMVDNGSGPEAWENHFHAACDCTIKYSGEIYTAYANGHLRKYNEVSLQESRMVQKKVLDVYSLVGDR